MLRLSLMILCWTFAGCRPCLAGVSPEVAATRAEVWVAPTGGASGEGSQERPFGSLDEALSQARQRGGPFRVNLLPGRYRGPFVLSAGLDLVGVGEGVVLEAEGTVVRAPEGVVLEGVELEGGSWGLEAGGSVGLKAVRFRGQGAGAVRMAAGHLEVEGSGFEAGGPEAVGLWWSEGSEGRVRASVFEGAFRRAVVAHGAQVELESVRFSGPLTAFHQVGGQGVLRHVTVGEGREVGLFVQEGGVRLEDVSVTGHEYGLQTLKATLEGRGLTSVGAARAGVALVGSRGELEEVTVRGSGGFGALSLVGSELVLRGVRVEGADAYGITATRGRLRLQRAWISGLTAREGDAGDGLHLRDVEVEVEGLVVRDVAGSGVLAAQGARVVLGDVTLEACRQAGVWVETLARVTAARLEVRGSRGAALMAMEEGVLRVDGLTARDNVAGLVMADCQGHTAVTLGPVTGQGLGSASLPCVVTHSP